MIADAFVLWRISDPVLFTRHLNGQVAQAQSRISASVFSSIDVYKRQVSSLRERLSAISGREARFPPFADSRPLIRRFGRRPSVTG